MVLTSHPIWCQDYRKSRAIELYLYYPVHLWHVIGQTLPFLTILILSSHPYPGFPSGLFPLRFLTKHLCTQVCSPPYMPHALPIFLFDLITKIIYNEHTPRNYLLCNFLQPPFISSPLSLCTFPNIQCSSLQITTQVLHKYKSTGRITV